MGGFVPGEPKEWALLLVGFVAAYYVVGHRRTTGKSIPGTAM
jgi:hypothetical protein